MESRIPSAENLEFGVVAQYPSTTPWDRKANPPGSRGLDAVLIGTSGFTAGTDVPEEGSDGPVIDPQRQGSSMETRPRTDVESLGFQGVEENFSELGSRK
jgi:hypothetical protein